jgi:hypothetical protein
MSETPETPQSPLGNFNFVLVEPPDPNGDVITFSVDSKTKVPQLRLSLPSHICHHFRSTTKPAEFVDVLLFVDAPNRALRLERIGNRANIACFARKIQFKKRRTTGRLYYGVSKELATMLEQIPEKHLKIGAKDATGVILIP